MSITALADYQPQRLGAEPWGSRLTRARELAGFTVRTAEQAIGGQFSRATITRLESLAEEPTKIRERQRATVLVVLYGFDPADFGLGEGDVPPFADLRTLRGLGKSTTKWYARDLVPA